MKKAYLVLEDGRAFEGVRFGAESEYAGELVFTTGVCGYIETLTDPANYSQIVMQTFPPIGNYGIIEEDFESGSGAGGYVVREFCRTPSNFRSQYDIDTFLKKRGIVGIAGIDTRYLTKILREEGSMRAAICDSVPKNLSQIKSFSSDDAVKKVSCDAEKTYAVENEKYSVTLIDYGVKKSIINALTSRGCSVRVVPADTTAAGILAGKPDGVMLSGGPGDPAANIFRIEQLCELLGVLPIFGVGLGHQLLALAAGGRTFKMKFGHRGASQPVRDLAGTRTYITSQNHGYTVESGSVSGGVTIFENLNDKTCEGIEYTGKKAFTVQFYPEASAGLEGTSFLYDRFVKMMDSEKKIGGKN